MTSNGTPLQRSLRQTQATDAMTPELRACVHEFGFPIVHAMLEAKVRKPSLIRQLVHEVWAGARQPRQRAAKREVSPALNNLDWLLIQAKAEITAPELLRFLAMSGLVIVPREPSAAMLNASMTAIDGMGLLTKPEKHRIRLREAVKAGVCSMWPHLRTEMEGK